MITPYQPKFVEKIVTSPEGKKFLMVFEVAIVSGSLKGRLISVTPFEEATSAASPLGNNCVICLPALTFSNTSDTEYVFSVTPIVSPYGELYFFTSQPTRAPSF